MENRRYYYSGPEEKYFFDILKKVRQLSPLSLGDRERGLKGILHKHDLGNFNHSGQVANLGLFLARESGETRENQRLVHRGGWLHDIGKIFIPKDVLNRDSSFYLTKSQYELLITHGRKGALIARMLSLGEIIEQIADQHWMGEDNVDPTPSELEARHRLVPYVTIADLVASAFDRTRKHQPIYTEDDVIKFMDRRFLNGVFPQMVKPAFDRLMGNSTYRRLLQQPVLQ